MGMLIQMTLPRGLAPRRRPKLHPRNPVPRRSPNHRSWRTSIASTKASRCAGGSMWQQGVSKRSSRASRRRSPDASSVFTFARSARRTTMGCHRVARKSDRRTTLRQIRQRSISLPFIRERLLPTSLLTSLSLLVQPKPLMSVLIQHAFAKIRMHMTTTLLSVGSGVPRQMTPQSCMM